MRREQLSISVIIPNWNGQRFLKTCLDSLKKQTFKDFEIIVVDNGSTDGSVEFIEQNYPQVKVIALSKNMGFCYAVNRGIKESKGKYIALLNNDTNVDTRWLEELKEALDGHPEVALCMSRIRFIENQDRINSVGIEYHLDGTTADMGYGQVDGEQFNKSRYIFGACSAAAIYRRALFDDIGLFDEDFFAYCEDVDLSFRAQLKGYRCLYVPKAIAYHYGTATAQKHSPFNEYYVRRNELLVLVKNVPSELLKKYRWRILWGQSKILLKSPILLFRKGSGKLFWARIKGKIDGLLLMRKFGSKREEIQKNATVSPGYIESLFTT